MKLIKQLDKMDCGPACLAMITREHGVSFSLPQLRQLCDKGQQGVTLLGLSKAAEELHLASLPLKLELETFVNEVPLPCIVHWNSNHYVVVYKIKKGRIYIADPERGKLVFNIDEFKKHWINNEQATQGYVLCLKPTERFFQQEESHTDEAPSNGLVVLFNHFKRFKRFVIQLSIGALLVSILNLIFPFLTQSLVDHGIGNQDVSFIYAILVAQLMLFFSRTAVEFIRGWILVHMGTRINVAVVSEFLRKMMRLPLSFFGSRNLGDVLQRITDHQKVEEFLTSHSINIVFSFFNLIVFSVIMASYSALIFSIFLVGSLLSIGWVTLFLNKRKVLDYANFAHMTANQSHLVQMVEGMEEIKLNDCTESRRWRWEKIQSKLFKTRLQSLAVEQYQHGGTLFLNESKNIIITFLAAFLVIQGELTLGMMMAITYILGQMNAPIEQLLVFIRQAQDAKISMERLSEFQHLKEENEHNAYQASSHIPLTDIHLKAVTFHYSRHDSRAALNNINLTIPHQKTTAIVGASGSGKTTLLKLLLRFFSEYQGDIKLGDQSLHHLAPDAWRSHCGVVMQDGFIFSDTVAENIAMDNTLPDISRVIHAAKTANLHDEIESLPQGYYTKIGAEGIALSGGQRQRILIARAVYKNPDYIFFDEATSALDANNEKAIQENLKYFFKGKTVVVIAHRLSTVKQADQIIVLDKGKIVEQGTHASLTQQRAYYYDLVKNQLELGN